MYIYIFLYIYIYIYVYIYIFIYIYIYIYICLYNVYDIWGVTLAKAKYLPTSFVQILLQGSHVVCQ